MIWLVLACTGGGDTGSTGVSTDLVWTDENTSTFHLDVDIGVVEVAAQTDIEIDWSQLTQDLHGQQVEAGALVEIGMMGFTLEPDELDEKLAANSLSSSDLSSFSEGSLEQGSTTVALGQLEFLEVPFNPEQEFGSGDAHTYTFGLGPGPAKVMETGDYRALVHLVPTKDSDIDRVELSDGDSVVAVTADLLTAAPLSAPSGNPDLHIDWSATTTSSREGHPGEVNRKGTLVIGHVPRGIEEAEAGFVTLMDDLDHRYEIVDVEDAVDLIDAIDPVTGDPFPGFSSEGTWLIALFESAYPAPELVAVVAPTP